VASAYGWVTIVILSMLRWEVFLLYLLFILVFLELKIPTYIFACMYVPEA
jgi:hypothetical protein